MCHDSKILSTVKKCIVNLLDEKWPQNKLIKTKAYLKRLHLLNSLGLTDVLDDVRN